jgi:hypothetical protein
MLLVLSRGTWRWFGRPMVQLLVNIKQFHQRKFIQIETKYFWEIGAHIWHCSKVLNH